MEKNAFAAAASSTIFFFLDADWPKPTVVNNSAATRIIVVCLIVVHEFLNMWDKFLVIEIKNLRFKRSLIDIGYN